MKIHPFRIAVPADQIADLHRRLERTRWPAATPDIGWAMGMDTGFLRDLAAYWRTRFDWRRIESALNALPQFQAVSDVGSIHFVHLEGRGESPLPIVLTHGWPSTFAELLRLGRMLADPVAHGRAPADAFDVVIPSLPGYAFSSPPPPGTNVFAIAHQWSALMNALGYSKFVAHGGDLGAGVSTALGLHHGDRVLGVHLNYIPSSYQPYLASPSTLTGQQPSVPSRSGAPAKRSAASTEPSAASREPSALSAQESAYFEARTAWAEEEGAYAHIQATKPDTLAHALNDSPVGLAAWIVEKFRSWSDCHGDVTSRFTLDELLTTVSLYWFTQSMPAAIRLYWEGRRTPLQFGPRERVSVPVAVARFPRELPLPPRSYVERGYNVVRWTEMPRGGHFAAMEEPEALADDIRVFARRFRPSQRA
jgi:pimeloyl-ACP methyl ester carboxylesterase